MTRLRLRLRGSGSLQRNSGPVARFRPNSFPAAVVIAMSLLPLLIIVRSPLRVNPDIAYFVEAGRRILAGDLPYVDFFSENLLSIKFLNVAPVAMSELIDVNSLSVWLVMSWIATAAAVFCTYRLSIRVFARQRSPHLFLVIPLCLATMSWLALITNDLGQREYIFVLAAIPWLLYGFCKSEGMAFRALPALTIGIMAGLVATIKPHFLFVIVAVQLCWLVWRGRHFRIVDAGVIGFALVPLANAAYFLLYPDALEGLIRWFEIYLAYERPNLSSSVSAVSLLRFLVPCASVLLAFVFAIRRKGTDCRLLLGLATFAAASAGIVLMQSLREFYRLLPLYVGALACCGLMLLLKSVVDERRRRRARLTGDILFGSVLLFAIFGTLLTWQSLATVPIATPKSLQKMLLDVTEPGDDILFMTRWTGIKHPWLRIVDRNEANSLLGMWKPPLDREGELSTRSLKFQLDIIRADIEASPAAIVVDRRAGIRRALETSGLLEVIESRYRRVGEVEDYAVYIYFGHPPLQGTKFTLGDRFELYSWRIEPVDGALQACDRLELTTWWRPLAGEDIERFTLHVDLVEPGGGAVVEQFGRIGGVADYGIFTNIIDQRVVGLPCESEAGSYWLLLSLEDMSIAGGKVLPVWDSHGAEYGKYVFLQEIEIGS